ncbi:hypothetical protein TNCV_3387711 [Trichonephila clavipes]|nr:hypothetical protein TNCV_3387711 [Trichonephila clavipes]
MDAVDFLHHENPPTWAGVEPATLGAEGSDKPVTPPIWRESIWAFTYNLLYIHSLQTKLPERLINNTNEWRLVQRHYTPLRVKGDIENVSSELDNGD